MNFHTFGDENKPVILLIHGVLTPWQVWEAQTEHFSKSYRVVVVALDAHEEERASEFLSIQDEAEKIENYVLEELGGSVFAICGISMGAAITNLIWQNGIIGAEKFVLDGAPLIPCGGLPKWIMRNNYITIIKKSKQRDPKVLESFKKQFLPERFLDSYLKIADNMTEDSIRNMINSVFAGSLSTTIEDDGSRLLFMHGTKGNELLAAKSAKKMLKSYPKMTEKCFKGYAHCEAAIYKPEEWLAAVEDFFKR